MVLRCELRQLEGGNQVKLEDMLIQSWIVYYGKFKVIGSASCTLLDSMRRIEIYHLFLLNLFYTPFSPKIFFSLPLPRLLLLSQKSFNISVGADYPEGLY